MKCKKLTTPEAISLVAHEVCLLREQKEKEFEWYKSHAGLATKKDLEGMEKRLTDAIGTNATITPAVESAAMRLGSSLDILDAEIPDKQTETKP